MGKNLKGKEIGNGIHQRKDGKYCARYVNRFGRRISLYNSSLTELRKELVEAMRKDSTQSNVIDSNISLDDWFEKWMTVYKANVVGNSTKRIYRHVYEKNISPSLGNRKISEIKHIEIVALIKELHRQGYEYATKNKVRIILLDMFNKAMIDEFVTKNPALGVKIYKNEKDVRVLSREEQDIFFECCAGTFYDNLFKVAITTGLRQGEVCALTWDDIDLENREINVDKTLLYQKLEGDEGKRFHIHPPKTKSSKRKVPISSQCEVALRKQKMQYEIVMSKHTAKPLKGYEKLLFTTKYGTPINAQIYSDAIRSILDEINLCRAEADKIEVFSSHAFRHTFATRCFESNIQPKTVQKYLGHANLSMTMDLYTHVCEEYQQQEMEKLNMDFSVKIEL